MLSNYIGDEVTLQEYQVREVKVKEVDFCFVFRLKVGIIEDGFGWHGQRMKNQMLLICQNMLFPRFVHFCN